MKHAADDAPVAMYEREMAETGAKGEVRSRPIEREAAIAVIVLRQHLEHLDVRAHSESFRQHDVRSIKPDSPHRTGRRRQDQVVPLA